jgi:hypothetical protein
VTRAGQEGALIRKQSLSPSHERALLKEPLSPSHEGALMKEAGAGRCPMTARKSLLSLRALLTE